VEVIKTDIARAFVDPNRAPDDLPPKNPDGVVKTKTCYGVQIYKKPLSKELINLLLEKYYYPYHNQIKQALKSKKIEMAFDCHSMAAVAPEISPDVGKKRPAVCLGNVNGNSCDFETTERLRKAFIEAFCLEDNEVTINEPFSGGYITRFYGNNPIPWVQIEINRKKLTVKKDRLDQLRSMFLKAVELFFS